MRTIDSTGSRLGDKKKKREKEGSEKRRIEKKIDLTIILLIHYASQTCIP